MTSLNFWKSFLRLEVALHDIRAKFHCYTSTDSKYTLTHNKKPSPIRVSANRGNKVLQRLGLVFDIIKEVRKEHPAESFTEWAMRE